METKKGDGERGTGTKKGSRGGLRLEGVGLRKTQRMRAR